MWHVGGVWPPRRPCESFQAHSQALGSRANWAWRIRAAASSRGVATCGPCAMSAPSQGRQRVRDYASAAAHSTDDKQSIPSFIGKLSIMLQEPTSTPYVKWADGGDSIVVTDPTAFATAVLPR